MKEEQPVEKSNEEKAIEEINAICEKYGVTIKAVNRPQPIVVPVKDNEAE